MVLHNFRQFGSHIIVKSLGKLKDKKTTCIPNNMEKYISFSLGNLRFIDSFQFMSSSLDGLVQNLKADGTDKFRILKSYESEVI